MIDRVLDEERKQTKELKRLSEYIVERRRVVPKPRILVYDYCQRCQWDTAQAVTVTRGERTLTCLRCKNKRVYEGDYVPAMV